MFRTYIARAEQRKQNIQVVFGISHDMKSEYLLNDANIAIQASIHVRIYVSMQARI